MNRIKKRSHRERRVGIVHRSRQSMISCGSEARGSSGGTVGREVEVEVERERERWREIEVGVWLKAVASEKRRINFLSQPMKVVSC